MASQAKIVCQHLCKRYGDVEVLRDVSFSVNENEFVGVIGPTGCGKTTLLNIISGVEKPTSGFVLVDGKRVTDVQKNMALIFQEIGLFPWKTALENVEYGLKIRGVDKMKRREVALKYLELVGLKGFENYYPSQLSGGMKQRVGIARAYAINPDILLLDEPFGHLDAQTRWHMENELLKIWSELRKTVILVTNIVEEAVYLANRIVVLTKKPASVKAVFKVNVPKDRLHPDFLKLRSKIEELVESAVE